MPTEVTPAPFRYAQQYPISLEHPAAFSKMYPSPALGEAGRRAPAINVGWVNPAHTQASTHPATRVPPHAYSAFSAGPYASPHMPPAPPVPEVPIHTGSALSLGPVPFTGPARALECLPNKVLPNGMRNPWAPYSGETYMPASDKADRMAQDQIAGLGGSMISPHAGSVPIPIPAAARSMAASQGWANNPGDPVHSLTQRLGDGLSISHSTSVHSISRSRLPRSHLVPGSCSPSGHHSILSGSSLSSHSLSPSRVGSVLAGQRVDEGWDGSQGRAHQGHLPDPTSTAGRLGRSPSVHAATAGWRQAPSSWQNHARLTPGLIPQSLLGLHIASSPIRQVGFVTPPPPGPSLGGSVTRPRGASMLPLDTGCVDCVAKEGAAGVRRSSSTRSRNEDGGRRLGNSPAVCSPLRGERKVPTEERLGRKASTTSRHESRSGRRDEGGALNGKIDILPRSGFDEMHLGISDS